MVCNTRLFVFFLLLTLFATYQIFTDRSLLQLQEWSKGILEKNKMVYYAHHEFETLKRQSDNSSISKRQIDRKLLLDKFCAQKYSNGTSKAPNILRNVLYLDKYKFIFCSMPKTGCTNWKKVMLFLDGKINNSTKIAEAKNVVELPRWKLETVQLLAERQKRIRHYYSFFFVRHPFERIFAAYRNKLKEPFNFRFQRRYGSIILKLFRPNLTKDEYRKGQNVSFNEFVDYVILTYEKGVKKGMSILNEHWRPMHKICFPCSIKYDYIGKMETLQEDADQILKDLGLSEIVKYPTAKATDRYKVKTRQIMKEHYASLSKTKIEKLYEIYKDDFKAFGYQKEQYF